MANKITVKFEAQGARALKTAIDQLHLSQVKLEKGTKAYKRALEKLNSENNKYQRVGPLSTKTTRIQTGAFATLRSQILLASFAFGLVNASVLKLGRAYGEQEQAEKRLEGLIGKSVGSLKARASALQEVTRFGDEQTLGAMSLVAAYTTNEIAIAKVTEAAMDLATVKGMDLNTATDMLSKSVFSSTNSMQRYGVQIDGVAGSGARLNSALKAISTQMGGAAKRDADTFLGAMDQMGNAVGDVGEDLGAALAPAIVAVAKATKAFAEALDAEHVEKFLSVVAGGGAVWLTYTMATKSAIVATNLFTKVTKKNIAILAAMIIVGKVIDQMDLFAASTDNLDDEIKKLNEELLAQQNYLKDLAVAKSKQFDLDTEMALLEAKHHQAIEKAQDLQVHGLKLNIQQIDLEHQLANAKQVVERLEEKKAEGLVLNNDLRKHEIDLMNANIAVANIESRMVLKAEKDKQDAMNKTIEISGDALKAMTNNAQAGKNIAFGLAMISAYQTFGLTQVELLKKGITPPFNTIIAGIEMATSIAQANKIRTQQFEQGGLVGGRRHSQGGTMIEAERGEFVMSRNAVESIGVNTLEAMNAGGGAVNINITGNVMSSDFVEGELADKITEAVRKGVDFGIS